MFHVHYINYDSKIARLLNTFLNKVSVVLQTLGAALTRRYCYVFKPYANLLQLVQTHSKNYKYNFNSINYTFDLRLFTAIIPNESTL